jgi:hypothetical protein
MEPYRADTRAPTVSRIRRLAARIRIHKVSKERASERDGPWSAVEVRITLPSWQSGIEQGGRMIGQDIGAAEEQAGMRTGMLIARTAKSQFAKMTPHKPIASRRLP